MTSIGGSALGYLTKLASLEIYASTKLENSSVFSNTPKLQKLVIQCENESDFTQYIGRADCYPRSESRIICIDGEQQNVINIPNSVTSIGAYAFADCTDITSVNIGEKVNSIGDYAFDRCKGLEEIQSRNVTPPSVPNQFLSGASIGPIIVVPASSLDAYISAENWSDYYQNIVPDNVSLSLEGEVSAEREGSGVFTKFGEEALSYAKKLKLKGSINGYDLMIFRNRMPNLHHLDLTETTIVGNPYEYQTGCYTEDHRLGDYAFASNNKLVSVKLPNSITTIGAHAFESCQNLKSVTIYPGVETIGNYAFSASGIECIEIPNGTKVINGCAFFHCKKLKKVKFGEGLLKIERFAFAGWAYDDPNPIDSISLPSSVTELGEAAFFSCTQLEYLKLSEKLSCIPNRAFMDCKSLKEVKLPTTVKSIDYNAFLGCTSLEELRCPPMLQTIGSQAFAGCTNIKNIYVYNANAKDLAINQNTFPCWTTATLHVPNFARSSYYWDTQWSQFYKITEFDEPYEAFYTKNTMVLDNNSGTIDGTPDGSIYGTGGLIVDGVNQDLATVELNSDGTNGSSVIPTDGGTVTASSAKIVIKVKKNQWHFFCFPFDIELANVEYDGDYIWRQYDGAARSRREGGWRDLADGTTTLEKGRGYIFQGTTESDLILTVDNPTFETGDVNTNIEVHTSDQSQDANWNYIGNPYTAYVDINETVYSSPITVWTGKGYETYRPGDDDYNFAPYQAFFVQTPNGVDNVGFTADSRNTYDDAQTNLSNAKARRAKAKTNPDRLLVNLELYAEGEDAYTDKTRVVFNNATSADYELECDASKFFSSQRSAEIYSIDKNGIEYSINERPVADGNVKLGLVANHAGTYTISAVRMDAAVLLKDKLTNTTHDLSLGGYEFTTSAGKFSNRFTLVMNNVPTTIESLMEKTGLEVSLDGGVKVNNVAENTNVSVYNIAGACVANNIGSTAVSLPSGNYILKVGNLSAKVLVK